MRRQSSLIAAALCAVACAQIAGFEQLSSKKAPGDAGAAGSGAGPVNGGAFSAGGAHDAGDGEAGSGDPGNVNTGNNAGVGATGGAGASAGGLSAGSGGSTGGPGAGSGGSAGGEVEVVGGCNAQQLRNAFFDAGPSGWTEDSSSPGILGVDDVILEKSSTRLTAVNVAPKSDDYLAWFGGRPNSDEGTRVNLMQDVQIPAKISNLIVTGWIRIRTTEPVAAESNDQLDIALQDDSDFWSFHVWRVEDATDEWQPFEVQADDPTVLDALRGRTLTFIVESKTDTSYETHFWLDSLSFIAECP